MTRKHMIGFAVLACVLSSLSARADSLITLTLEGPRVAWSSEDVTVSGEFAEGVYGLPQQTVDIFVDGAYRGSSTTTLDTHSRSDVFDLGGEYSFVVGRLPAGRHTLVAKAYTGTPAEISSSSLTLSVLLTGALVDAGADHTCALRSSALRCWGANEHGQIGDGATSARLAPFSVPIAESVADVSTGTLSTCVVTSSGKTWCWGANAGAFGNGSTAFTVSSPSPAMTGILDARAVAAGYRHACVLRSTGQAACSGDYNGAGQGTVTTPVTLTGLSNITKLAAGADHTCAVLADSSVRCWGRNTSGQLGDGTNTTRYTPTAVPGLSGVAALAAGDLHTCAILGDGSIRCWGSNAYGQLGDGTTLNRTMPVQVAGISGATAISAGAFHTCATLATGVVRCWGRNYWGTLGDGSQKDSPTATTVTDVSDALAVAAGASHACALRVAMVSCWGLDRVGQLGDGFVDRTQPRAVVDAYAQPIIGAVRVSAGETHTCLLDNQSRVACWGSNDAGEQGDNTGRPHATPNLVPGLPAARAVIADPFETAVCALLTSGAVDCWGGNFAGELGDGSTTNRSTPTAVVGVANVVSLSMGTFDTCAVLGSGAVDCWGSNVFGQLGDGTTTGSTMPVAVAGLADATSVAAGDKFACALRVAGQVACWGLNDQGQLGNGTTADAPTPVSVTGVSGAVALVAGTANACALKPDATLTCWGAGFGAVARTSVISDVANMSSGASITITDTSGTVRQIGSDGTIQVFAGLGAIEASSSFAHICAVTGGGGVLCWGDDSKGQLGDAYWRVNPIEIQV